MRISYDLDGDTMYIRLIEGDFKCHVVRLTDDVLVDFDSDDRLIGLEVLGASRLFETPGAPTVELKDVLPQIVTA